MNPRLQRATMLLGQSRPELAEQELRLALADDADDALAHALLAQCLAKRKEYQEATDEAHHAVHLAPENAFTHYTLSLVLADRNHLPEAIAAIHEALRIDPDEPAYYARLAALEFDSRRWPAALAAAEQGLQLNAEDADCANLRAMALVKLGRQKMATSAIDEALARDPDNAYSHANQGWAKLETGDHAQALEHFREALRIDPQLEWARQGIVEALRARYFIYRIMLGYFLWMMKLSGRAQWMVIMGLFIGYQVLRSMARNNPALAPWVTPVLVIYFVFAAMTWIAQPLFNLVLRLNRFGRLALSREEIITSNLVGGLVLLAVASLVAYFVTWNDLCWIGALAAWATIVPTATVYHCDPGWPRRTVAALAVAVFLVGLALVGCLLSLYFVSEPLLSLLGQAGNGLVTIFLVLAFASPFASNALAGVRVRK